MKAAVCLVTEVGVPFDPETAGLIMKYSSNSDMYQPEKATLIGIHWINGRVNIYIIRRDLANGDKMTAAMLVYHCNYC